MHRTLIAIALVGLTASCASSELGKRCRLSAEQQNTALSNIRGYMLSAPDIDEQYYINDELELQAVYNSKQHCTFVVRPNRPITTAFAWDGTWAFRVDKATLLVDKHYPLDVK